MSAEPMPPYTGVPSRRRSWPWRVELDLRILPAALRLHDRDRIGRIPRPCRVRREPDRAPGPHVLVRRDRLRTRPRGPPTPLPRHRDRLLRRDGLAAVQRGLLHGDRRIAVDRARPFDGRNARPFYFGLALPVGHLLSG